MIYGAMLPPLKGSGSVSNGVKENPSRLMTLPADETQTPCRASLRRDFHSTPDFHSTEMLFGT